MAPLDSHLMTTDYIVERLTCTSYCWTSSHRISKAQKIQWWMGLGTKLLCCWVRLTVAELIASSRHSACKTLWRLRVLQGTFALRLCLPFSALDVLLSFHGLHVCMHTHMVLPRARAHPHNALHSSSNNALEVRTDWPSLSSEMMSYTSIL